MSDSGLGKDVRGKRMVRLFKEEYEEGGVLSNNDVALQFLISAIIWFGQHGRIKTG